MHLATALVCAALGLVAGRLVPVLVAALPEPEPDPGEKAGDFPDKVLYAALARRPVLGWGCAACCAVVAGSLGLALGRGWGLAWLVLLVPIGCALAVVDYVTWYLPGHLVNPGYLLVAGCEVAAAVVLRDWHLLRSAAVGFALMGGYYGLMWLISPRIMAYGDVRLGGLLGLALGPFGLPTLILAVFGAALVGVLAWVPLKVLGNTIRRDPQKGPLAEHYPFGPFMLVAAWLAVLLTALLASTGAAGSAPAG